MESGVRSSSGKRNLKRSPNKWKQITVSLHSEAEANVFGLHWRPSYELKLAVIQGFEGLADYATAMFSFVFYLPAILLWLAAILVAAALGWKALRLGVRVLFAGKKPAHLPA